MKQNVFDLQSLTVPADAEDEALFAMFPARRESALNDMYLVRQGAETYLLRKEDVARVRKLVRAVLNLTVWGLGLLGLWISARCWAHGVGHPWAWLTIGESCLVGCLGWEVRKRRRP